MTWVWENEGIGLHNVLRSSGRSGEPESGPLTFSYTFTEVGTFRYYCQVHGALNGVGMAGRVIVQSAQP